MADVLQLDPHERMTVEEALAYTHRNHAQYTDVIIVCVDSDGDVFLRSSHISRAEAVFHLLEAVDQARGK